MDADLSITGLSNAILCFFFQPQMKMTLLTCRFFGHHNFITQLLTQSSHLSWISGLSLTHHYRNISVNRIGRSSHRSTESHYHAITQKVRTYIQFCFYRVVDHTIYYTMSSEGSGAPACVISSTTYIFLMSLTVLTVKGFAAPWSSLLEIIFAFFLVSLKRSIDGGFINIT